MWLPVGAVLCEMWLPVGMILFGTSRFDKEVDLYICVDTISEWKERLVDNNNNWCWREQRVWWNVLKDMEALEDIIFTREN